MPNVLHIMHVNINGIRGRLSELVLYLNETKPSVLCLNETKLDGAAAPRIPGFSLAARRDRQAGNGKGGGGVAIYVHSSLATAATDISPDVDDIVAIELETNGGNTKRNKVKVVIVAHYSPPQAQNICTDVLESIFNTSRRTVLAGDFNALHAFYGCRKSTLKGERLFGFVESLGLKVHNPPDQPTHLPYGAGKPDILDYIITSGELCGEVEDCWVGECVGSDHLPVHLKVNLGGHTDPGKRLSRIWHKADWDLFQSILTRFDAEQPLNWRAITDLTKDGIDDSIARLQEVLIEAVDQACPLKEMPDHNFRLPPLTVGLIREKRRMRRRAQKDPTLKAAYNALCRKVKETIADNKRESWRVATGGLNGQRGKPFWDSFQRLTARGKRVVRTPVLRDSLGQLQRESTSVAMIFAEHLGTVHRRNEGPEYCTRTERRVEKFVNDNSSKLTSFSVFQSTFSNYITPAEIAWLISKARNRKAPGADGIFNIMLKHLPHAILFRLSKIFNACLGVGYFPDAWKQAIGVMLPKPEKDPLLPGSYRPISLLSALGKVLEKAVVKRLNEFLDENHVLNEWQRAYRKGREAAEIISCLASEVCASRDARAMKKLTKTTGAFSLDVEKAFDSVWHEGLLYKMHRIGVPQYLIALTSSFLKDRVISVRVGESLSAPVPLRAGTPQGSVLSPLLYLLYVNDIPLDGARAGIRGGQFADDITVWGSYWRKRQLTSALQDALSDIEDWCKRWRIKLNAKKTQFCVFGKAKSVAGPCGRRGTRVSLRLQGTVIYPAPTMKILGVVYDRGGSLRQHCVERAKLASRRVNLLRMVGGRTWGANTKTLLRLYKSFVRPVLEYGYSAIHNAPATSIETLRLVERRALRHVYHLHPRTSRSVVYELFERSGNTELSRRLIDMHIKAHARHSRHSINTVQSSSSQPSTGNGYSEDVMGLHGQQEQLRLGQVGVPGDPEGGGMSGGMLSGR